MQTGSSSHGPYPLPLHHFPTFSPIHQLDLAQAFRAIDFPFLPATQMELIHKVWKNQDDLTNRDLKAVKFWCLQSWIEAWFLPFRKSAKETTSTLLLSPAKSLFMSDIAYYANVYTEIQRGVVRHQQHYCHRSHGLKCRRIVIPFGEIPCRAS